MTRREQLAQLVDQQARDDAADRIGGHFAQESQIGDGSGPGIFASVADPRALPADARLIAEEEYTRRGLPQMAPPIRVVGDGRVWTPPIVRYTTSTKCPVCHDRQLPKPLTCLCCHASAYDPKRWDMQETPKQASKREKLKGGMGATLTPGKRGRKALWGDYQPAGKV